MKEKLSNQICIFTLDENDKCMPNGDELCQIFCGYFSNIICDFQIFSISKNVFDVAD